MDERRRRPALGSLPKTQINGMRSHAHLTVGLVRDPFFICYDMMGLTLILPHQLSIAVTGCRVYSDPTWSLKTAGSVTVLLCIADEQHRALGRDRRSRERIISWRFRNLREIMQSCDLPKTANHMQSTVWTRCAATSIFPTLRSSQRRLPMVSIPQVPPPRSVYTNSEAYAATEGYSQHHIHVRLTFSVLVPACSPPEVTVMYTRGLSMV